MDLLITGVGIVVIFLLIAISGFFSSSELAVFSVPKYRIDALVAEGSAAGIALGKLRENPHRFLVTVLVSNNGANIAAASVATALLVQALPPGQAATISTVVTSFFVIVLGEIAPKSYAVTNAESWALRVSRPVAVVQRVIRPLLFVFEVATNAINRLTGGDAGFESYLTREEIETIVLSGEETGALDAEEGAMIRGVLDLEATTVRGVMVPRTSMVGIPETASLEEVLETAAAERFTRLPVYGENRDDVRGIIDVRDAIAAQTAGTPLSDVLTDPLFVPETKPVDELLDTFQLEGRKMAIVVDEFGSVVGLVTTEDLIEEVVGEIFDRGEHNPIRRIDDGTAVVAGRTTINYVNEMLGLRLPTDGSFETIAGLVQAQTGGLPAEGDRIEIAGVVLTVVDGTATRIRRLRLEWES